MDLPIVPQREGFVVGKVQFLDFDNDFLLRCA